MSQKEKNYYGFRCPHCSEPIGLIEAEVVTDGRVRRTGRFPDATCPRCERRAGSQEAEIQLFEGQ